MSDIKRRFHTCEKGWILWGFAVKDLDGQLEHAGKNKEYLEHRKNCLECSTQKKTRRG